MTNISNAGGLLPGESISFKYVVGHTAKFISHGLSQRCLSIKLQGVRCGKYLSALSLDNGAVTQDHPVVH